MTQRQIKALDILNVHKEQDYSLLGEGSTSVVFTNNQFVYKVIFIGDLDNLSYKKRQLALLKENVDSFNNSDFFYPIKDLVSFEKNHLILIYPFEQSHPCVLFNFDEIEDFLVECWQRKLIFQDLKPENFIRVSGKLKWIDYEPDNYTDNLFLNMATRGFIYVKYKNQHPALIKKICRSAINNFELEELKGLQDFLNRIFSKIIFAESRGQLTTETSQKALVDYNDLKNIRNKLKIDNSINISIPYADDVNPDRLFFDLLNQGVYLSNASFSNIRIDQNNYFSPSTIDLTLTKLLSPKQKTTLIIKACVQDSEIIYEATKHIISQLASPNLFDEKLIAVDIRKSNFLREYNGDNNWEDLIEELDKLKDDNIIDNYIYPDNDDIIKINKQYFNINSHTSHTIKGVPVSSQLFAFESAKNDYVLQVDCDAIIGRLEKSHSFLDDMIKEIELNTNVLSVGFNIYKGDVINFKPYFGFEDGGFVPEVRFCLLNRRRLHKVLPLNNDLLPNGFKLSWYRSLEKRQKETNTTSIRGGSSKSFFIHPPNFKKTDKDVWFTKVDRVEQLKIPESQINEFDLVDSYYNWIGPKRDEEMVVISSFRNINLSRFLRYWCSLTSQSFTNWGLILIDDNSENGISHFIKEIIKPYSHKITFISNKYRMGTAHNTYKAIHYLMTNQQSIVTVLDGDDALIGKNTLNNLYDKYSQNNADVVIGKMFRTDKFHSHYKYTPNFINPRLYGGNVWQHIRSFKKYLYDSLDFNDLKIKNKYQALNDILLSKRFSQKMVFPEHCSDYSYMVPIVEMSKNPMSINHFNILHDRTTINTNEVKKRKNEIIDEILSKKVKSPKDVFLGRKTFLPNLRKIEIDITYECNLKCVNCNRSSTQAPIKEGMTLDQINEFVRDSISLCKKWELINILGGEPTIHKDFNEIVNLILNNYIVPYSPNTILQITSNGYGDTVKEQLAKLPNHKNVIIDYASFKDNKIIPYFSPFNNAPIDNKDIDKAEYEKGCWVTSYCGIGLNQLGYYPCGVAGGIDRVFEMNLGVKKLKDVDESISKLLSEFCQFCGNFTDYEVNQGNFIPRHEKANIIKPKISAAWKKQYRKYNGKK